MSNTKQPDKPNTAPAAAMTVDAILGQLAAMKDKAEDFLPGSENFDEIRKKDIEACEAATEILSALQDEGIEEAEQVRNLIHDYRALAKQYRAMHQKYEVKAQPINIGNEVTLCPECKIPVNRGHTFCYKCGKKLGWNGAGGKGKGSDIA